MTERSTAPLWAATLVAAALFPAAAHGSGKIVRIEAFPPEITLETARDQQRFIVQAVRDDDVTLDITDQVEVALGDESLVRLDGHTLYPQADGATELRIKYEEHQATIPVVVARAGEDRPISFKLDVMPVFMRAGCNTGSCHGAARGKDGFMLSLFGFDPDGDHFRLTREISGRRINLAIPDESLLIEKAIGTVPHTGGTRFEADSQYNETLIRWLKANAPNDQGEVPQVLEVELYPKQMVLEGEGATQQMIARARYSDGTNRDVTDLAVFLSNNDNSAEIDQDGQVTAGARGEAFVMARFETHTVGSQVIVLPENLDYTPPEASPTNYIDELVNAKLQKLRILPSELCSDEVFLRRVTLDITGRVPTPEEYEAFVADESTDKRARLIDDLLARKEFSEIWAMKWAELLMIRSTNTVSYKSAFLYSSWLTEQISNDVPVDQMVRELLSASGGTFQNPATNYYQIEPNTLKISENVAQVFMGIRTQCAQCHNHPFDRWTMDDYYSFAAFFSQIGRKTGEDYRETIVFNSGSGDVKHPVGGRVMPPKFLGGETPDVKGRDRREVLVEWLASPDNPYFAPSLANRVWAHFFGIGIVEPVDDIRISNPPSNPELLARLGEKLIEYRYDFKQLVRDICNSQTYQRSTARNASNETDELNFAHANVRRIQAEHLLDSISLVTDTKDKFRGLPRGARAVEIADGSTSNYFLTTFGRSARQSVCACEVQNEPTLSQALHMINGDTIQAKIVSGGLIKSLLKEELSTDQIIERLYLRALSRKPTDDERAQLASIVEQAGDQEQGLQDIFWALLNSREFVFNH